MLLTASLWFLSGRASWFALFVLGHQWTDRCSSRWLDSLACASQTQSSQPRNSDPFPTRSDDVKFSSLSERVRSGSLACDSTGGDLVNFGGCHQAVGPKTIPCTR